MTVDYATVESCVALTGAALLLAYAARRRSAVRVFAVLAAAPLAYRGLAGRWPAACDAVVGDREDTRVMLAGEARGIHVRESIRLERPLAEVYAFWRHLANLPQFMTHLDVVTESSDGRSHWVAKGPGGLRVAWDAQIINEVEHQVIAWRSLPGSDIVTAGSVNFDAVRGGRSTQVTVHLQYAPPAGRAGAFVSRLVGREPSQTIREDLRRLKQLLEAGEVPQAVPSAAAGGQA